MQHADHDLPDEGTTIPPAATDDDEVTPASPSTTAVAVGDSRLRAYLASEANKQFEEGTTRLVEMTEQLAKLCTALESAEAQIRGQR